MSNCVIKSEFKKFVRPFIVDYDNTGKPSRFNTHSITGEMIAKLMTGSAAAQAPIAKVVGDKNPKLQKFYIDEGVEPTVEGMQKVSKVFKNLQNSEEVIETGLALHLLIESIKGEADKARNNNIKITDIDTLGNGYAAVPLARLAPVIGRHIMYTKSKRFANRSPKAIEEAYKKIGMKTLDKLASEGFIEITPDANMINDFMVEGADTKTRSKTIKGMVATINIDNLIEGMAEVEKQSVIDSLNKVGNSKSDKYDFTTKAIKRVYNLVTPSNILLPLEGATEGTDITSHDIGLTETSTIVLDSLNSAPVQISSYMDSFLTELAEKMETSDEDFKKTVDKIFEGASEEVFGLFERDSLGLDKTESVFGQNLSKTTPMVDLLNHWKDYLSPKDGKATPIHLVYKFVRNARMHAMNTVLNSQTSKSDRGMLTTGSYSIDMNDPKQEAGIRNFVAGLMDESGLTLNEIKGIDEKKSEVNDLTLTDYVNEFKESFTEGTLNDKLNFLGSLLTSKVLGNSNFSQTLSMLLAVKDFREGLKTGTLKSEYMTKPDGTASGGTIAVTQAVGYSGAKADKALETLNKMGILESDTEIVLNDMYAILTNKMETLSGTNKGSKVLSSRVDPAAEAITKLMEAKVFPNLRELSKPPSMVVVYGQGRVSGIESISTSIADAVFKQNSNEAFEYVKDQLKNVPEMVELFNEKVTDMKSFREQKGAYVLLKERLGEPNNISDKLYTLVKEEISDGILGGYNKVVSDIYKSIKETANGRDIKILPAMAVVDGVEATPENIQTYGIPLQKVTEILDTANQLITREEIAADTTAKVNTIHGSDAAINTLAIRDAIDIYEKSNGEFKGTIPVHDQDISDPVFNAILEQEYVNAFQEVNQKYSIPQQLINTLEALAPEHPMLDQYKEIVKEAEVKRQEALSKFDTKSRAVFGFKNPPSIDEILDTPKVPEPPKPTKKKEESKVEETETVVEEEETTTEVDEEEAVNKEDILKTLEKVGESSAVVRGFVKALRKGLISTELKVTKFFEFLPTIDTVNIGVVDNRYETDTSVDKQSFQELIEHKIVHSYVVGYTNTKAGKADNNVKFIRAITDKLGTSVLKPERLGELREKFDGDTANPERSQYMERLLYIITQKDDDAKFQEFVAVMKAEPEAAKFIYGILNNEFGKLEKKSKEEITARMNRLKDFIDKLWDKVAGMFKQFDAGKALDIVDTEVDLQALALSIEAIVSDSMTAKHSNYTAIKLAMTGEAPLGANTKKTKPSVEETTLGTDKYNYVEYTGDKRYDDFISLQTNRLNNYTYAILTKKYDSTGKVLLRAADTKLAETFPLYVKTKGLINRTYDNSEFLQELVHHMSLDGFINYKDRNDFITKAMMIAQDRTKQISTGVAEISTMIEDFTPLQKESFFRAYTQAPMFHLFKHPTAYLDLEAGKSIDEVIANIVKSNKAITEDMIKNSKETAKLLIRGEVTSSNTKYNSRQLFTNVSSNTSVDYEALVALESLALDSAANTTTIKLINSRPELLDKVKDYSLALYNLSMNVYDETDSNLNYRDNLVTDQFKEPVRMKVITNEDLEKYSYNTNGWRVIRKPSNGILGVAVQNVDDNSMVDGVGINASFFSTDIDIPKVLATEINLVNNNVVKNRNKDETISYKLVLTNKEKRAIGLLKDPAQALVKSMAHIESIKESQVIRDTLLRESFTRKVSKKNGDMENLIADINSDNVDHPWLIKLEDGIIYEELPPRVKAVYKPISSGMPVSKVKGFDKQVSLVRKDVSPWLTGYKVPVMFENNATLRRTAKVVKEIMSMSKIGMIIVNPIKIAKDLVSNNALLLSKNVPIQKIAVYGRKAAGELGSLNDLRGELIAAKLKLASDPKNFELKDAVKSIDASIKEHPLAPALFNGMLTSISTDIIMKDYDTVTGLQSDIDNIIGSMVLTNKKEVNALGKIIMKASKLGFNGEDILRGVGKILSKEQSTNFMGQTLEESADRIAKIKNEDDVVKYISQFLIAPNAESVKIGSAATQISDVIPKITYYMHLKDNGKTEKEAVKESLELFPDYKVNMPKMLKLLSDYFVLGFPSFWVRDQRIIVQTMVRNAPTVMTGFALGELLGIKIPTVFDANIVNKFNNGTIINTPQVGMYTFVPSNIFRF